VHGSGGWLPLEAFLGGIILTLSLSNTFTNNRYIPSQFYAFSTSEKSSPAKAASTDSSATRIRDPPGVIESPTLTSHVTYTATRSAILRVNHNLKNSFTQILHRRIDMDDESAFNQDQITPPAWDAQCRFCKKFFPLPGALTKHMNSSCLALRKGLKKRLSTAQNVYATKKQARLEQQTTVKKKWYHLEGLDVDVHGPKPSPDAATVELESGSLPDTNDHGVEVWNHFKQVNTLAFG
jgi:hypothetical protein